MNDDIYFEVNSTDPDESSAQARSCRAASSWHPSCSTLPLSSPGAPFTGNTSATTKVEWFSHDPVDYDPFVKSQLVSRKKNQGLMRCKFGHESLRHRNSQSPSRGLLATKTIAHRQTIPQPSLPLPIPLPLSLPFSTSLPPSISTYFQHAQLLLPFHSFPRLLAAKRCKSYSTAPQ